MLAVSHLTKTFGGLAAVRDASETGSANPAPALGQVRKLNQQEGGTVFLTTHYLEEAERVARRIAVIDRGKIIAQGSPAELKQRTASDTLEEAFLA
jgi:ABC-type branched-subunit amino acid transport system ATPase component